jgi:hypothetical protein
MGEGLTFFNTILIRVLLAHGLALISASDALHALVEMVLGGSTLSRFLALCILLAYYPITKPSPWQSIWAETGLVRPGSIVTSAARRAPL